MDKETKGWQSHPPQILDWVYATGLVAGKNLAAGFLGGLWVCDMSVKQVNSGVQLQCCVLYNFLI